MPPETAPAVAAAPAGIWLLLHVLGVAAYAGSLLAVVRLLAQGAALPEAEERALAAQARRAYLVTAFPASLLMIAAGLVMLLGTPGWSAYAKQGWMHMKLTLVLLLLVVDHAMVLAPMKRLARGQAKGTAAGRRVAFGIAQAATGLLVAAVLAAVFLVRK